MAQHCEAFKANFKGAAQGDWVKSAMSEIDSIKDDLKKLIAKLHIILLNKAPFKILHFSMSTLEERFSIFTTDTRPLLFNLFNYKVIRTESKYHTHKCKTQLKLLSTLNISTFQTATTKSSSTKTMTALSKSTQVNLSRTPAIDHHHLTNHKALQLSIEWHSQLK